MRIVEKRVGPNQKLLLGYIHDPIKMRLEGHVRRPALVICPGGGYHDLSSRESDPIAIHYLSAGYQVFTLFYSVGDELKTGVPLLELSEAVAWIKDNAEDLNVFPDKIGVIGFSAGGHVAGSLATLWNSDLAKEFGGKNRPDCALLCYPVITADEKFSHRGSFEKLCRGDRKLEEFYSLEKQVSSETVPCFLFHTSGDPAVPVENSLMFASALSREHIPFEAHFFQGDIHGISLATKEVGRVDESVQPWFQLSCTWLNCRWNFQP